MPAPGGPFVAPGAGSATIQQVPFTLPQPLPLNYAVAPLGSPFSFLTVVVGGIIMPQMPNLQVLAGLDITDAINARTTCRFDVLDVLGSTLFLQGMSVQVVDQATGTVLFGGLLASCVDTKPSLFTNTLLHHLECVDYHYLADKRIVATSYPAGTTCGFIVQDLINNWLGQEGVQVGGIQTGPVLGGTVTFNYKSAAYCLDFIAQLANFSWFIDANRRLWFFSVATFVAPWTFDGTQFGTFGTTSVDYYNKGYRNSQYVLGTKEVTAPQTETRQGDGSTRAFPLGFPIHQQPSDVHVNSGAAQTVGVKGVSSLQQWYWSKGDSTLYQDPGQPVLASTDTLHVTYVGEFNVVAYVTDAAQVAIRLAREGIGTGTVQDVVTDTKLTTANQAFQNASALLKEYSGDGVILTFKTIQNGLQASQMLTVALPAPFNVSGQFLIEQVRLVYAPSQEEARWTYEVTATQGPVSETWVQWFLRLALGGPSLIDAESLGQQSQVALLQLFPETWTWTESVVQTVNPCFVFTVTFPKVFC